MNYLKWSQEYKAAADRLTEAIEKLRLKRTPASPGEKKEIDKLISQYRICRKECLDIANHLMQRHRGVA